MLKISDLNHLATGAALGRVGMPVHVKFRRVGLGRLGYVFNSLNMGRNNPGL